MERSENAAKPTMGMRSANDLEGRYGEIGIAAVAAALRCGGERKETPHRVPVVSVSERGAAAA